VIALYILNMDVPSHFVEKRKSPIRNMMKVLEAYKMDDLLKTCMLSGNFGKFIQWKKLIKNVIWSHERMRWRASCMMYSQLSLYVDSIQDIKLHPWWQFARLRPSFTKYVSCVIAVLQGGQPLGLQCNFESKICQICGLRQKDNHCHILFACLADDLLKETTLEKCRLLLSGLKCGFVCEWMDIYANISKFVFDIYHSRKLAYNDLIKK